MELIIVPTAHVSKASVEKVRRVITDSNPDIVAVELCQTRFRALMDGAKPSLSQMVRSPLYSSLFLIQQLLGKLLGSKPGNEMKEAILAAAQLGKPVLLADEDITKIMKKISSIPLREKLGLVLQIFTAPFSRNKLPHAARLEDLSTPSFLAPILMQFKSSFPITYKYLVDDRNRYMLGSLLNFQDKKIVLVIGAGHAKGICELADAWVAEKPTERALTCVIS